MIISIRGASGAGKSHLVRRVVAAYATGGFTKLHHPALTRRVRPYGTIYMRGDRRLFVPGHYEIANGGIDTLETLDEAYSLIYRHHAEGLDVLYEGKNMSDGRKHLIALKRENEWDCRAVLVHTSVEECVRSVRDRGHSISEASITKTHAKCWRDYAAFSNAGLRCRALDREHAYEEVIKWLTDGLRSDSAGDTTRAASTTSSV